MVAAENNIIIKITSEADLSESQLQLRNLKENAALLEKEMKQLNKAEQDAIEKIKQSNVSEEEKIEKIKKATEWYAKYRLENQGVIDRNEKNIASLKRSISTYKSLNDEGGRMVVKLRSIREQLMQMEEAGEFGSDAFIKLSMEAGKLEDQIGDTQQRIRVLSSDTKEIDAVMGLGDGLAGAFYVATSGAELLGGDIEGLQNAFYKVQAAMSAVSGVQQMYNALNKDSAAMVVLNTALTKLFSKSKKDNAAATAKDAAITAADTASKRAQATATTTATVAQKGLNAAFKANPIGIVIAALVALVAAVVAVVAVVKNVTNYFNGAAAAQREYAAASKELEKVQAQNAVGAAKRAYERQQQIQAIDNAEQKALDNATDRNASELEMAQIKANYAKQRAEQSKKYTDDEIARNNREVAQLQKMVAAKQKEVNAYKQGSDDKKKAQEELNEVSQQYYDALQKTKDLEQSNIEAQRAAADAARELQQQREQLQQQLQQANIDLMKEGAAKEIAQIKLNYQDQLKAIQGSSDEEVALRKKILAKQAKEIAAVRKKYAQQEQQTAIQEQKNLLKIMSQSGGTEEDYAEEIALTKQIAEAEAQARIDALDKSAMSERAYKAEVESIRLELADSLREIDEQEVQRLNENAQRSIDIALQEAEARKNALTGAESMDEQKAVVKDYYDTLSRQIEENAEIERQSVMRSTDTAEVKAEKIKQIDKQMHADIAENTKNANQELIDIDSQYIAQLERNAADAADAVSKAQVGGKIDALKANLDAQLELQKANLERIEELYANHLITYQEFQQQKWEITKEMGETEANFQAERMQQIQEGFSTAVDYMQQAADIVFGAISENIQQQMDDLDNLYTTDAEEAKKDADKKYISEKELAHKKLELKRKQAAVDKASAAFSIGLNTAMAIMSIWADPTAVWAMKIALSATTAALGAAQLAMVLAKPLPAYAKGRKATTTADGEYALVGEKGAEIMFVPKGAGIIPHNKISNPDTWGEFNVPTIQVPDQPKVDSELMSKLQFATMMAIDYNRLGKAVADNVKIPKQTSVSVNVDRNGVTMSDGIDTHRYLNKKYAATWR